MTRLVMLVCGWNASQEEEARRIAEEEAREEAARKAIEEEKARKRAKAKEKVTYSFEDLHESTKV